MQRLPDSSIPSFSLLSFPLNWREFHVSRDARANYEFPHALFATNGHVVFADFRAARTFAQKINEKRQAALHPERAVKAGQLNALGLLDEVMHHIIAQYRARQNPHAWAQALERLEAAVGSDQLDLTLHLFIEQFPPLAVYRGEISVPKYLAGETAGQSHREIALEEMLILWLENANPAAAPYRELFNDFWLESETAYPSLLLGLHQYFDGAPRFNGQSLIEVLRA
ncbi:MAG: hypothetical protein JWN98_1994, partial [Abditibacteriota bacterium]|nr:hypothetical protein [Abditibacteriota bacterium]